MSEPSGEQGGSGGRVCPNDPRRRGLFLFGPRTKPVRIAGIGVSVASSLTREYDYRARSILCATEKWPGRAANVAYDTPTIAPNVSNVLAEYTESQMGRRV